MDNIKGKQPLKKYVYSIRLTKEQRDLLKNNEWIKRELDEMILKYLNIYLSERKR